jgi:hypothetical protein
MTTNQDSRTEDPIKVTITTTTTLPPPRLGETRITTSIKAAIMKAIGRNQTLIMTSLSLI